jgi:hypothetical protein
MTGTLELAFEFLLDGIEVATSQFRIPNLSAKLRPGSPVRLEVTVTGMDETPARELARRFAREFYRQLLLRFGGQIALSWGPREGRGDFKGDDGSIVSGAPVAIAFGSAPVAKTSTKLAESELQKLAADIELRLMALEVPTSADLYSAIEMFAIGLETENKIVRYLVLYSALALAALFKSRNNGSQARIDMLIIAIQPSILRSPLPKDATRTETLYTKLRNDLIHAEDRGSDPAKAIAAIERHIKDFQTVVARVLAGL